MAVHSNVLSPQNRMPVKHKKTAPVANKGKGKGKENIPSVSWDEHTAWAEQAQEAQWEWKYLNDFSSSKVPPLFSKDGRCVCVPIPAVRAHRQHPATSSASPASPSRFSQSPVVWSSPSSSSPSQRALPPRTQDSPPPSSTPTTFFSSSQAPPMVDC